MIEVSAFGGYLGAATQTGFLLTDGIRWGAGVAFMNILQSGFRVTAELTGEHYLDNPITAPAGPAGRGRFAGADA